MLRAEREVSPIPEHSEDDYDDLLEFIRAEINNERAWRRDPTSVYLMFNRDHEPLYVGITRSLIQRIPTHASDKDWFHEVAYILHEHYRNRDSARRREAFLIHMLRPEHNKVSGTYRFSKGDKLGRAIDHYIATYRRDPLGAWAMEDDLPNGIGGLRYRNIRRVEGFQTPRRMGGLIRTAA